MQTDLGIDALTAAAIEAGMPAYFVSSTSLPAVRLAATPSEGAIGGSRLGGLPDLPAGTEWPRWDPKAYDDKELTDAEARGSVSDFMTQRVKELRARVGRGSLPLTFLAQLDLRDLVGLDHGLPLPEAGHLFFFYELSESTWGYCPTHSGSFRVLFAPEDAKLVRREPPDDLPEELVVAGTSVKCVAVHTMPTWPELEGAEVDAYEDFVDEVSSEVAWHQVGGHPDEIQGDMKRACALVTAGVYLGAPPDLPESELERLSAGAPDWRLLLQLSSDDDLDWMWGDVGNIYFWMREEDIAAGRWEEAWFQLQCS